MVLAALWGVVKWLKTHAPHITPQTNTFQNSNPEMLYQSRQFAFAPEEYSIQGKTGNALAMAQYGSQDCHKHAAPIRPAQVSWPHLLESRQRRRRSLCHSRRIYPLRSLARASLRSPTPVRRQELSQFANNQMVTERYRLDSWPLFYLGDNVVSSIESDSLVRIQVYSALAFGSRGLYYYCW